jgi:hypothetical protein
MLMNNRRGGGVRTDAPTSAKEKPTMCNGLRKIKHRYRKEFGEPDHVYLTTKDAPPHQYMGEPTLIGILHRKRIGGRQRKRGWGHTATWRGYRTRAELFNDAERHHTPAE